jgi:hypothetical protein
MFGKIIVFTYFAFGLVEDAIEFRGCFCPSYNLWIVPGMLRFLLSTALSIKTGNCRRLTLFWHRSCKKGEFCMVDGLAAWGYCAV